MNRVSWSLVLAALLLAPSPAPADDGAAVDEEVVPSEIDFHAVYKRVSVELKSLQAEPVMCRFKVIREAWRLGVKPRAGSMLNRVKKLDSGLAWVVEKKGEPASGMKPEAWSGTVRSTAALYTELGTMLAWYRKAVVTYETFHAEWLGDYFTPEPVRDPPSRDALWDIEQSIRDLEVAGLEVPYSLTSARDTLQQRVREEEEAERERTRRIDEANLKIALPKLRAHWTEFDKAYDELKDGIASRMQELQGLIADAQLIEEHRLRVLVEGASDDEKFLAGAEKLLTRMATGRAKAVVNRDPRWSRYGSLLRQKWLLPRKTLVSRIRRAVREKAKADAGPKGGGD